jgi:hypothetical protein
MPLFKDPSVVVSLFILKKLPWPEKCYLTQHSEGVLAVDNGVKSFT